MKGAVMKVGMSRLVAWSVFSLMVLAGWLAVARPAAGQAPEKGTGAAVAPAEKKLTGRLPAYYGEVVSKEQRARIYEIQARYGEVQSGRHRRGGNRWSEEPRSSRRDGGPRQGGGDDGGHPRCRRFHPDRGLPCARISEFEPRHTNVRQALGSLLLETSPQQPLDGRRRGRRQARPVRLLRDDGRDRVGHVFTAERALAGEHLVEDAAKRPDVGAAIDRLALRLLRRHVCRRAEDHTLHRHRR